MKRENYTTHKGVKRLGFAISLISLLGATSALGQTHVNAHVNMSGSCASCDLSNRDMPRISFQESNFSNSNFSRSNLSGATFHRSNLQGASFHKAYLMRVKGNNINMRNAILRGSTLIEAKLINSDISHADLRQADLSSGDFHATRFISSNFIGADAVKAQFMASDFSNAKLNHGDFKNAIFDKAIFIKTDFGDANVANASFLEADFSAANLTKVRGLTPSQIKYACGNAETELPAGMKIKTCIYTTPQDENAVYSIPAVPTPSAPPVKSADNQTRPILEFVTSPPPPNQRASSSVQGQTLIEALESIDDVLKDIPFGSPMHAKLSKTRRTLERLQSQQYTRFQVKSPK